MPSEIATKELTERQRAFVRAFVGEAQGVATRAATIAGYSSSNATRLMSTPAIRSAIGEAVDEAGMSVEEIVERIAEIARFQPGDYATTDEAGKLRFDFHKMEADGKLHLIRDIYLDANQNQRIIFADCEGALRLLAKIRGMIREGIAVQVNVGTDQQGDRMREELLAKLRRVKPPIPEDQPPVPPEIEV
jgi:hypothetical protein